MLRRDAGFTQAQTARRIRYNLSAQSATQSLPRGDFPSHDVLQPHVRKLGQEHSLLIVAS
jgi:hypothetical protein